MATPAVASLVSPPECGGLPIAAMSCSRENNASEKPPSTAIELGADADQELVEVLSPPDCAMSCSEVKNASEKAPSTAKELGTDAGLEILEVLSPPASVPTAAMSSSGEKNASEKAPSMVMELDADAGQEILEVFFPPDIVPTAALSRSGEKNASEKAPSTAMELGADAGQEILEVFFPPDIVPTAALSRSGEKNASEKAPSMAMELGADAGQEILEVLSPSASVPTAALSSSGEKNASEKAPSTAMELGTDAGQEILEVLSPPDSVPTAATSEKNASEKAPSTVIELDADAGQDRLEVLSPVTLEVDDSKKNSSNCGSLHFPGMQSDDRSNSGEGVSVMESRSPEVNVDGKKKRSKKYSCVKELRSLLLDNLGTKEGGNRSGRVLNLNSPMKACEMIRTRGVSNLNSPDEAGEKKRKRKLDSSQKSNLSERSPVSKMGRSNSDDNFDTEEKENVEYSRCFFVGEPVPDAEARQRWPWRYEMKSTRVQGQGLMVNDDEEDKLVLNIECHYTQAQINECIFELGDCASMRGENGQKHVGRILEFFRTTDKEDFCRVQWFYRAEDTVMKGQSSFHDEKRLFYSTIMNDNLLESVISKLKIIQITSKMNQKSNPYPRYDYYYDMEYCLDYSTFRTMPTEGHDLSSPTCNSAIVSISSTSLSEDIQICELYNKELSLLDLYSGCGAMSTGLCLGAKMSGVDLVTRWAVDFDGSACESLRINHPKAQVRNESAEDFLGLLKQWEKLCKRYVDDGKRRHLPMRKPKREDNKGGKSVSDDEEYEVERLLGICYGDPDKSGKQGLKFKVRWKGYGSDEDTWEPMEGLGNCEQHIHDFVTNGFKSKILPLPGDLDVICGGPPCQGISGYNRHRSVENPFDDERNLQLQVYMDIVKFLKPRYVLMENVVDILKFDKGSLGRYALSRLVHMNYQSRVGIMAAGCYGLPQFRLRVFFWGAQPTEDLPQFPLPTHDCIISYWPPLEFERNVVAYDKGQSRNLQDAVLLHDAVSDLPAVGNDESADEMPYGKPPETEFQTYIRSIKCDMTSGKSKSKKALLYDHRPYPLHEDDYIRVCHIPRRKGANFRDLPGIIVGEDNVVRRDPTCDDATLPSGKPMVPDYALSFEQGKSRRPFGRLWWDETIATVVTSPTCHSQVLLHPEQDRVLTVRECARLQGFPDHYRFSGTVKKRYRQIGNAVPIPVAKALGYAFGMASQKLIGKEPLMELPPKFAYSYGL